MVLSVLHFISFHFLPLALSFFLKIHYYYYIKYKSSFGSDEFKMFNYKVDLCLIRNRSHNWTSYPYIC